MFAVASAFGAASLAQPAVLDEPSTEGWPRGPISAAEIAAAADGRAHLHRFGLTEAPAKTAGAVRIATYNLENLFDDVDDPALSGREEDAGMTKPAAELAELARAIRALDADVLAVQEIEGLDALTRFRDAWLADMGYEFVVSLDVGGERGIENGVLSRFPVVASEVWPGKELGGVHPAKYGNQENWYAGQKIAFRRSPLMVEVEVPAGARGNAEAERLTLFVVHHKSGQYSGYWREAEAAGVLKLIEGWTAERPDEPVVVLGDFNAQPADPSVRTYLEGGFHDLFTKEAPAGATPPPAFTTHESERRIDLVLLNGAAWERMVPGSGFVLGTASRPVGVSWRDLETFPGYASDHYPVAVEVMVAEPGAEAAGG
jgi:endonuclease/exonuclease/phosphatase family metal-dependent hydrolase